MEIVNEMRLDFRSCPENEALARMVISAFIMPVNPTLEQLGDVKTAVSEAVTNAIVHGYRGTSGLVRVRAWLDRAGGLTVEIADKGCGIKDGAPAVLHHDGGIGALGHGLYRDGDVHGRR